MWEWGATQYQAEGNTVCTRARGPCTATASPRPCTTTHPAWSRPGCLASTTHARTAAAQPFLRASSAAWRSRSVSATISLSTSLRSNSTSLTCSGWRGRTREVACLNLVISTRLVKGVFSVWICYCSRS